MYIFVLCILFYLITLTGLGWILNPELFFIGSLLGLIVSIAPILGILKKNNDSIIRLNISIGTIVMCMAIAIAFLNLYLWIKKGEIMVAYQLMILVFTLGLSACLQLIQINFLKSDPENVNKIIQNLFAGPPIVFSICIASIVTSTIMVLLVLSQDILILATLKIKIIDRGIIPPITLILFFWGLFLFIGKWYQLRREWQQLFSITRINFDNSSSRIIKSLNLLAKQNQTERQSNSNIETLLEICWQKSEFFLAIPRYINWSIPILGFIGTVLGISLAAESIGLIISNSDTSLSSGLGEAIAPLGIAFDTTLVALTLSVVLMLIQTLFQRWEDRHLVDLEQLLKKPK